MSSEEFSIRVEGLSKRYEIYTQPAHRLKQMIFPRLQRVARRPSRAYFNEFWALRDVSFEVERGETVGIVGRNGSGKSTLLQMICGTLAPTLGTLSVNGRIAALLELGAGFNPEFTGRENVRLSGLLYGLSEEELRERYDAILEFAEIGDFINQPVKTYSSGMYVRLAFAVAINVSPDILVIDEALSVGDEAFQRKCFARIDAIRKAGATILFVSHAASTVIELCNRAILLDQGELLTQGTPKYVVSRYQKLLYSPADKYPLIRNAIREEVESDTTVEVAGIAIDGQNRKNPSSLSTGLGSTSSAPVVVVGREDTQEPDESFYEEGLVSKSTFRYEAVGASILDPHIENSAGRRVNILQARHEYVYVYKVRFDQGAAAVRCGMLIKSITGLELAGCVSSWRGESLPEVAAGVELEARFRFPCMFAPGAYFMNAGVQGIVGDEHIYLDRWIDGAIFKVAHAPGRLATTTIDLGIKPEIRVLTDVPPR
jgi:lipopolysaccharide transport system ATP-binding protein